MSIFNRNRKPTRQQVKNSNLIQSKQNTTAALRHLIENSTDSSLDNLNDTLDSSLNATLGKISGNIQFKNQFNLIVTTYFDKNGSFILPAALDTSLQTKIVLFLFGQTDFIGGYLNGQNVNPLTVWKYSSFTITQSPITGLLKSDIGDLRIILSAHVGIDDYAAYINIHCPQLSYGSLISTMIKDSLKLLQLRYISPIGKEYQFQNILNITKQAQFGKVSTNFVDPKSYITPGTQNKNISDIPLQMELNNYILMSSYITYDVQLLEFSFMLN